MHLKKLFKGRKANLGMTMFLGVIMFNIVMFIIIYAANADVSIDPVGSSSDLQYKINATTNQDISTTSVTHWYSGFQISVFDMPWWIDIFYVTLQGLLLGLSIYSLIRGLS